MRFAKKSVQDSLWKNWVIFNSERCKKTNQAGKNGGNDI